MTWRGLCRRMSMNLIDQNPGRGSGSSCRDRKNPANVTAAAASQMNTPNGQYPRRGSQRLHEETRDGDGQLDVPHSEGQTAILQCPLYCSSGGSPTPRIVTPLREQGHWPS